MYCMSGTPNTPHKHARSLNIEVLDMEAAVIPWLIGDVQPDSLSFS